MAKATGAELDDDVVPLLASSAAHVSQEEEQEEDDLRQCRICLSTDDPDSLIAPCLCAGSSKYVHRDCLDEWRAQERVPRAFDQCPTCKFEYNTFTVEDEASIRRRECRFSLFIARDSCGVFALSQAVIGLIALLMHAMDASSSIPKFFPTKWASEHAAAPYYASAVVVLLALLGILGLYLKLTGNLPQPPQRVLPRHGRGAAAGCDRCCARLGTCPADFCFYCSLDGSSCEICARCCCLCCQDTSLLSSSCVDGLFNLFAGAGEGALLLVPIVGVLLLVFAVIGAFVGIFFFTVVFQRIVQTHIHLLHMRSETQRVVVVDLAASDLEAGSLLQLSLAHAPPGDRALSGKIRAV